MSLKSLKATHRTVLFITWAAFLLRAVNLDAQSLWRDEVDAIRFSGWAVKDLLAGLIQEGHNGPLFFLMLRPWRNLTGNSEFALRYPSALVGALAVPLGYVLARQLGFSRRAGVLLGLLLATSPYLVWYGQEAKMYAMLMAAVMLAFIAYLKALTGEGTRWWIVFVVSTSISFYLHILAPLMLIVYAATALLYCPYWRRHWPGWLMSMACLTVPYIPLVWWQLSFLIEGVDRGHPFYPLTRQFEILLKLYSSGLLQFVGLTAVILFVFLFLCGLFLSNPRSQAEGLTLKKRLVPAAWALLPPLVVYAVSLRVPVFEDRYLIYIAPAFYLIIVLGIILVRFYSPTLAALSLGLILTINFMGIWQQQQRPIKADFRAAAAYLLKQPFPPTAIMVQMPYLQHTLNYYYPQPYTFIEGLWTNDGKSEDTVNVEMTTLTANLTSLWLVTSEEDTWDNRHLVRAWLNKNGHLVDEAHFMRVDVYHYQLRPGTIDAPHTGSP